MAAAYASGYNTFVPQFDASGHLVVNFSRDPKSLAINNYTTLIPVKKSIGYYLEITREEAARVLSADMKQYHWPDGNDAPTGIWSGESFEFKAYETKRYAFPFMLGYKAQEQADWKILASHAAIYAQQAMTARTMKVAALACNSSNYGSNTSSASTLAGGKLDVAAVSTPYIRKAIAAAAQAIHLATLGVVQPSDLCIVIGPEAARKLAATEEIHGYVKESATAIQVLNGEQLAIRNGKWGLPD